MQIAHVGRVYGTESRCTLLKALRSLIEQGAIPADRIQVEFVGRIIPHEVAQVREARLEDVCTFRGLVPQAQAFEIMMDADVLLVEASGIGERLCIRAKLFEYMLTGNPVLGIVGPGPMRDVVEKTGIGLCAGPNDVEGTKRAILLFYDDFQRRNLRAWVETANIESFDRRRLTAVLAEKLDAVVDRGQRASR